MNIARVRFGAKDAKERNKVWGGGRGTRYGGEGGKRNKVWGGGRETGYGGEVEEEGESRARNKDFTLIGNSMAIFIYRFIYIISHNDQQLFLALGGGEAISVKMLGPCLCGTSH